MRPHIAVIGAGPLGLMALKTLREDGFEDVVCYEARSYVGGLWKYSEDSALSVAESTIFNSSRYRSAISDFPFPADTDDFPTWQQMHQYLESYCDHFNLRQHIHLDCPVTSLSREDNRWVLEISPPGLPRRREYFEKVVVAIGSFVKPKIPQLDDLDRFGGSVLHAINFHQPTQYKGKNVLLVGLHATAQDVAVALSGHASKIYVSHRNGVILVSVPISFLFINQSVLTLIQFPRYTADGAVFDKSQSLALLFLQLFLATWFPNFTNWLYDTVILRMSAKAFPNIPKAWNLSPAPSISVTPPLIADEIFPLMRSGFVEPVSGVSKITSSKSVELTDGRLLSDIDVIIYCTGYDMCVPFMTDDINPYPATGEAANLYRGIFPLHEDPAVRNSLAYLGHAGVTFPGFVQYEMIAMAVSQIWLGKSTLPPFDEMKAWHGKHLAWREDVMTRQKIKSTFYVVVMRIADHMKWLDKTAGTGVFDHFGWLSAKAWYFWWTDRSFYNICLNGLLSPALWRLFDTGKRKRWPGAREQVLQDNMDVERQIQDRNAKMNSIESKKTI